MEEKKSGRKLSLNRVWDRTAALTGVSRSIAQKILEEKKAHDEQLQPSSTVESVTGYLLLGPSPNVLLEEGSTYP